MSDHMRGHAHKVCDGIAAKRIGNVMDSFLIHGADIAKSFSNCQANKTPLGQITWRDMLDGMKETIRPYADIAERLKWHRSTLKMSQAEYAASIGIKRSAFSLWEAGTHRLSLDGALALRSKYGLSLDFMYEGIDDALSMTLRNAWRERS